MRVSIQLTKYEWESWRSHPEYPGFLVECFEDHADVIREVRGPDGTVLAEYPRAEYVIEVPHPEVETRRIFDPVTGRVYVV